jgi:hypothetical protein
MFWRNWVLMSLTAKAGKPLTKAKGLRLRHDPFDCKIESASLFGCPIQAGN